jgi:hypothetical protein
MISSAAGLAHTGKGEFEVADDSVLGLSDEAQELVREDVARKLPLLSDYSDEQLLAEISPFVYGSRIEVEGLTTTGPGAVAVKATVAMPQAGLRFLRRGPFHNVICEDKNREMIKDLLSVGINVDTVTIVVTAILSLMGITAPFVAPASVVALALILLRRGIDFYCQE